MYFLNEAFDPATSAFTPVLDPPARLVTTTVDTDRLEEQIAVLDYAGGLVPFAFTEVSGAWEMRADDVIWAPGGVPSVPPATVSTVLPPPTGTAMSLVFLVTKD